MLTESRPERPLQRSDNTFEHLIIGAGITGLVLASELNVPVFDKAPGGYKVGESVIPEQFHDPRMSCHLEAIRQLPSWAPKRGTVFQDETEVAFFPLTQHLDRAMHVARHELEPLLAQRMDVQVMSAEVLEVDVVGRRLRTDKGWWYSRGPLLDCSGPAMLVANALGEVQSLDPLWATWGYHDVLGRNPDAFWHNVTAQGRSASALDVPSGRLMPSPAGAEDPTAFTNLIRIDDGLWMWHIPLYQHRVLSVGVVSRRGPINAEQYDNLVRQTTEPLWTLKPRIDANEEARGDSPLSGLRHRQGFANRAKRAASEDFILVGDAFAFGDPVYSVGTGLAVTQAFEIADRLNAAEWTIDDAHAYHQQSEHNLARMLQAFEYWYQGKVLRDDRIAALVQRGFLTGESFRGASFAAYTQVVEDASRAAEGHIVRSITQALNHSQILREASFEIRTEPSEHAILLSNPTMTLQVCPQTPNAVAWRWVAQVGISYQSKPGQQTPTEMMECLAALIDSAPSVWQRSLGRLQTLRDRS
ncbi:MAG TPA: hypothetical protein DCQ06_00080 [Myxococcales bacterium]|nr:hypothetical protein [Myxococcales bacterium]